MPVFRINPQYVDNLSESEIKSYLEYFRDKNYENDDPLNCGNEVLRLLIKIGGGAYYSHSRYWRVIKGEKLYRTRSFEKKNLKKIKSIREFYSPNRENVSWGRLNKKNEPILYTSFKECVAYQENKNINKGFLLIEYKIIEDFELILIGKIMESPLLLEEARSHYLFNVVNTFLEQLMLEKKETENYYILTNGIIDKTILGDKKNGFVYQSAVINNEFNAAINTSLEETLVKVNRVWYCEKYKNTFRKKKIIYEALI